MRLELVRRVDGHPADFTSHFADSIFVVKLNSQLVELLQSLLGLYTTRVPIAAQVILQDRLGRKWQLAHVTNNAAAAAAW